MDLPHQLPSANMTLTAQCLCKSVHFTITVPTSALPLPIHLCHCHICRYTHGTPCIFHAPLPKAIEPQFISPSSLEASLTGYEHSQAASTRFFCSTCGCHIGDRDIPDPDSPAPTNSAEHLEWRVATSIFSLPDPGPDTDTEPTTSPSQWQEIFQILSHTFANPISSPSGLYNWIPAIDSRPLKIWNPPLSSKDFPIAPPPPSLPQYQPSESPSTDDKDEAEVLLAQCHCAGVSFTIPRPSSVLSNTSLPEPWKDYIRRYLPPSPSPSPSSSNDPPNTQAKPTTDNWSALLDLCSDCRLVDGTHVIGWTFVPLTELRPRISTDLKHGMLKVYASSKGVKRAFCGTCGATVFYLYEGRRWTPGGQGGKEVVEGKQEGVGGEVDAQESNYIILDIATGILRAPGGVAAEDWLTWRTGRVAWYDSGERYDAAFARSLARGLREWGVREHGEAVDFEIP